MEPKEDQKQNEEGQPEGEHDKTSSMETNKLLEVGMKYKRSSNCDRSSPPFKDTDNNGDKSKSPSPTSDNNSNDNDNNSSHGTQSDRSSPQEDSEDDLMLEGEKLIVEPNSFEGVASAYRYKLTIQNQDLYAAAFNFTDDVDVFSFAQVNKKRAAKKEEWPFEAPLHHPQRCDVRLQLYAGKNEIKSCGGCSMWKELTSKPFLVLTPHGNRCVQFLKQPFILLIFRCCPKFHSYAKQFKLVITVTSAKTGKRHSCAINILRKKMNTKKRKELSPVAESNLSQDDIITNSLKKLQSQQQYKEIQQQYQDYQDYQPKYQQKLLNQHNLYNPAALNQILNNTPLPPTSMPTFPLINMYPNSSQPEYSFPSLSQIRMSYSSSSNDSYQNHNRNTMHGSSHSPKLSLSPKTSQTSEKTNLNSPFGNESWRDVSNFIEMESQRVKENLKKQSTSNSSSISTRNNNYLMHEETH